METNEHSVPSGVKIQINSAEALKRLLGDDPAFILELKNHAVKELVTKHLEHLIAGQIRQEVSSLQGVINETIQQALMKKTNGYYSGPTIGLRDEFKEKIKLEVNLQVDKLIKEQLSACYGSVRAYTSDFERRLPALIENYWQTWFNSEVQREVNARLERLKNSIPTNIADEPPRQITVPNP